MLVEQLWKVLDGVQSQIRAYDSKAQIVIGIDGGLAGFLATQISTIATAAVAVWPQAKAVALVLSVVACLVLLAISLGYATFTVYPRLKLNQPSSLVFFDHIAKAFNHNYAKARESYANRTEEEHRDDLSSQILANSIVSSRKAARFHIALIMMWCALFCWFASIVLLFNVQRYVAAYGSGTHVGHP
jgi:hypothetical protein